MKCEKCGINEANFHYSATINGDSTERSLCWQCANEEGFGDLMGMSPGRMYKEMFAGYFGRPTALPFGGPMGQGAFVPYVGGYFPGFFRPAPAGQVNVEVKEESEDKIPAVAGEEMLLRREVSALRHQLRSAVDAEEYEKAAELRDRIREMDKK